MLNNTSLGLQRIAISVTMACHDYLERQSNPNGMECRVQQTTGLTE